MKRQSFMEGWTVRKNTGGSLAESFQAGKAQEKPVILPHDAMISEERTPDTKNGSQTGFYPGGVYHYRKKFEVPAGWEEKTVVMEIEGAYMNTRVYVNGDYAGGYPHGYSNFYIDLAPWLRAGEENEIEILVNNGMELNSRWYSGSGLYRPVRLMVGEPIHIAVDGVRITTPEADEKEAVVCVETLVENTGRKSAKACLVTELWNEDGTLAAQDTNHLTAFGEDSFLIHQRLRVDEPKLWDCDSPNLYRCTQRLTIGGRVIDETEQNIGIRRLQLDSSRGFRLNGKEVKLRGACIHHDNGVIGACTLPRAEERRCRQLKEAGFNCIRSSHHPMSKEMLDACDRIGMLVIDELSDMWTKSKNSNDYSWNFQDYWEKDVEQMVRKDFNHPCVIMYSMGNEIQEAGTARGAWWNRRINNKIKSLDNTRYTTNAINGLLAGMDVMGEIVADITGKSAKDLAAMASGDSGEPAKENSGAQDAGKKEESARNQGGSDALNSMMGLMTGPMADAMAAHPLMSEKICEFAEAMDIAGYNYMTGRHELEHLLNPNRVVLGTETFPADIVRLWDIVKKNHHVIGDMTWTGYDYLGEAGIGIFYYDGTVNFSSHWPDRVAYIGDIDITGYRRPISYLREIVYGRRKEPYLAVERPEHYGKVPSKTPWMWKDNIASWTFRGMEGRPVKVDVYSDADEVELFRNGVSLGRKPAGEKGGFVAEYETQYEPGELTAVGYRNGVQAERTVLETASDQVGLEVHADRTALQADGQDLAFVEIELCDGHGRRNMQEVRTVSINVQGAGTLQGFGSADPQAEQGYQETVQKTFDGRLLAVVRTGKEPGEIQVTCRAEGCEEAVIRMKAQS